MPPIRKPRRQAGETPWAGLCLLPLLALLCFAACVKEREVPPEVSRLLAETVRSRTLPAEVRQQKERRRAWDEMQHFYAKRGFQPAWSDARGPLPRAADLLSAIDVVAPEGIDPGRYDRPGLERRLAAARDAGQDLDDPQAQRRLVDLDVTLTYTFLTMAAHLATGRLQPDTLRTGWYTKPRNVDLDGVLARALASKDKDALRAALAGLTPPGEEYHRLRAALARYREIAAHGGWPAVGPGPALRPGATGERVARLRDRLAAEGDLAAASQTPAAGARPDDAPSAGAFDPALAAAVSRFQKRHGLPPTGIVDADTLAELDVPAAERVRQIALNMERWRWLPSDLGPRYVVVNVPEFRLGVVEGGRETLAMRVIVGKAQSQTPVFSDQMTYIELNPSWNVPADIVRNEIAPAVLANPSYLASKGMEVVQGWGDDAPAVDPSAVDWSQVGRGGSPYRVRQLPGPDNALGRIKFMFPNQFDVYLHDTPADHLFNATERDFSHGCVRVEFPVELAAYLLRDDPKWPREAIEAELASTEPKAIPLKRPLPVHILYWTAWVDPDGTVEFRKDVYGHDGRLDRALAAEPPVSLDLPTLRGEQRAGDGARS